MRFQRYRNAIASPLVENRAIALYGDANLHSPSFEFSRTIAIAS
ncbi:hypothetical protein [Coleofasciculus sp. H7-2]